MDTVLYHPTKGYYMNDKTKLGKEGDFYTNNHIHSIFGKVFANVFLNIWKKTKIQPVICEIGGGDGKFAKAVLDEFSKQSDQVIRYYLVEESPFHQKEQRKHVPISENVVQFSSLEELKDTLPEFKGILFSNELFDSFPVEVVEKKGDQLYEVRVGLDENDQLCEKWVPLERDDILEWLSKNDYHIENGQRIEIPLVMTEWIYDIANWSKEAFIFTIDYGYKKEEWSHPAHRKGSLRGYYQHKMIESPLKHPGKMDLTTHIHLDAVKEIGLEAGLTFQGMIRQDHFLLRAGILDYLQEHHDPNPFSEVSKQNRAIRSFITGSGISSSFQVIIQSKGLHVEMDEILPYSTKFFKK